MSLLCVHSLTPTTLDQAIDQCFLFRQRSLAMTTVDGMTILGTSLSNYNSLGDKNPAINTTQLSSLAQSVIDTAVMVWMQMGLTNDQIKYGIAALNEESGFFPDITNG